MADIVDISATHGPSGPDARPAASAGRPLIPLEAVPLPLWRELCDRAAEPNAYYLADWELAVNAFAPGRTGSMALAAWQGAPSRLIGLMPVVPLWRAFGIALPALVSAHPYGTLCTPLLDSDEAQDAASELLRASRHAGARALVLREVALDGPTVAALTKTLRREDLRPRVLRWHDRACLDASRDADTLLREALGAKKLKELRRQRHRLAEHGEVSFEVARTPREVADALEIFLSLEASGWKGKHGTALAQVPGDAAFIRRATRALSEAGRCEIVTLRAGDIPVAAGIVLRHQDRAFFFKLGVDERFARYSPGVQLTLELTRHLCADPAITSADSTAAPDHPMINPIWRGRLAIADMLIPLRRNDPVVALIHGMLLARQAAHHAARRVLHFVRSRRKWSVSKTSPL
ncbi:MAG: GNAT family N-acetyltransferase [Bradyrhizobium sp.]|nr:GNAT family N-acetyltransferase [Bradyrhizobium sp.]